jgi:BASS family bile acid:Na+ symporter
MSWRDLTGVLKMPKQVILGVVCHYLIMPFVALTIARLFRFPPEIGAGVVLVGCCPSGLASNVIAFLARANVPLSVTITAVSTLLAPICTPVLMFALGRQFTHVAVGAMFLDVLYTVVGPVGLGILFHHFVGNRSSALMKVMPGLSMAGVVLIIVVITASGQHSLIQVGVALVAAMFLHMTMGFTLGYLVARLCRLPEQDCRTISIEVGMQNGGLASGIAVQMGKIATVGLAPAVNGPIMNVTFSLLGTWWGRKAVAGTAQ